MRGIGFSCRVLKAGFPTSSLHRSFVRMTVNGKNAENEPHAKVQKLEDERITTTGALVPELRVKKLSSNAILPSRATLLSAGYDLSSASEIVVPARGKALVHTDLSIAIPLGTYGRIGTGKGTSSGTGGGLTAHQPFAVRFNLKISPRGDGDVACDVDCDDGDFAGDGDGDGDGDHGDAAGDCIPAQHDAGKITKMTLGYGLITVLSM